MAFGEPRDNMWPLTALYNLLVLTVNDASYAV